MQKDAIKKLLLNNDCPFCKGSGIVKTFDFANKKVPNGEYTFAEILEKYGEWFPCCEGCKIMN